MADELPPDRYIPPEPEDEKPPLIELLKKSHRHEMLRDDIIARHESELLGLVDVYKSLPDDQKDSDAFNEERAQLREQLITRFVSTIFELDKTVEPNYEVQFTSHLEDAYHKQKAAAKVIDMFNDKMRRLNEAAGKPIDQGVQFDHKDFKRFVDTLSSIYILDQLIHNFDLLPWREEIIRAEINKQYKVGKP